MMLRTPTVGVSTARSLSTAVAMKDQSTETVAPIWLRKLLKAVSAVIFIYKLYFVYIYLIIYCKRELYTYSLNVLARVWDVAHRVAKSWCRYFKMVHS